MFKKKTMTQLVFDNYQENHLPVVVYFLNLSGCGLIDSYSYATYLSIHEVKALLKHIVIDDTILLFQSGKV